MTRSERDTPPAPQADLPPIHESLLPREHPLHRPRHGGRQRTALTCALVFFLVPAVAFVFGVRPVDFENHRLADFPSAADGWGFFTGLSGWATDHLPLRNLGVQAENRISNGVFGESPAFSGIDRQNGAPTGPIQAPTTEPSVGGTGTASSQVIEGASGWLYYAQDMTSKCAPAQPLSTTISELVDLRGAIESSGRSLVLVVAPDKSTVVPQYLPAGYPDEDCANAAANPFWSAVTNSAGAIDLRAGLGALGRSSQQPVYYPADTHWTDAGAIYMLRAIADAISPGLTRTWRSSPSSALTGPADLATMNGAAASNHDQTYHLSPDGHADRTGRAYSTLDAPTHFGSPPTTGMVTTSVALLGDSFTLAATRYLPAVFSDATAIDYGNLASAPGPVIATMVGAHTIVLEVVERNLAAGNAAFLRPQAIGDIRAALASHPMR